MGKNAILISTDDWEYGKALGRAISQLHREFTVKILESDEKTLSKLQGDLIIIQQENIELKVFLSEFEEANNDGEGQGPLSLYKYDLVSNIVKGVFLKWGAIKGGKVLCERSSDLKIVGVLGTSGGVGASSIAITLARQIAAIHRKKTLYISLDEFDCSECYFTGNQLSKSLNDFLYYFFYINKDISEKEIEGFLNEDFYAVSYFTSSKGYNGLRELSNEELISLLYKVMEKCSYKFLILDMPKEINEQSLNILELCNSIINISDSKQPSQLRGRNIEKFCKNYFFYDNMENKVKIINNCKFKVESLGEILWKEDDLLGIEEEEIFYIEHSPGCFRQIGDKVHIEIDGTFGLGVRAIAEKLVDC